LYFSESAFTLGLDRILTASATTIATSPGLNVTGGGAALAVEVGFGVAGAVGEGVGAGMAGEGLAAGAAVEARGVGGAGADGAIVDSAESAAGAIGVEMADPAGEHAASASMSSSPHSRARPVICLTSSLERRL
jgi:hypothetical protein